MEKIFEEKVNNSNINSYGFYSGRENSHNNHH